MRVIAHRDICWFDLTHRMPTSEAPNLEELRLWSFGSCLMSLDVERSEVMIQLEQGRRLYTAFAHDGLRPFSFLQSRS